jgi:hypothetical protein
LEYAVALVASKLSYMYSPTCHSCGKANETEILAPNLCFGSNKFILRWKQDKLKLRNFSDGKRIKTLQKKNEGAMLCSNPKISTLTD